jgi:hypothetical protein
MHQELRAELIDDALEGLLSEEALIRLEAELAVDEVARRVYYDRVLLTTLLETEAAERVPDTLRPEHPVEQPRSQLARWRLAGVVLASVVVVLLGIVSWQGRKRSPLKAHDAREMAAALVEGPRHTAAEQEATGYAILAGAAEAVWEGGHPLLPGAVVPPGELHLQSGLAQFELFSGVTLVVEGEARLSILSAMEVAVAQGKVRAHVPPPAEGFRVRTQVGEIVDLGTEFAVDASLDQAEVHVLNGEVEWNPNGRSPRRLRQGEAARASALEQITLPARGQSFVDARELQQRILQHRQTRLDAWLEESARLAKDPQLLVHYQLTPSTAVERRLPNRVADERAVVGEAAVVGAAAATDRWGRPGCGLDFSPAGSRVRMQTPGEYQHLTAVCWVRINSLDRWYNSLFLTDGHEQGEPHWQIMDDGRLFFSVKKRDVFDLTKGEKDKHIFYSPPFWNPGLSGQWLMIAVVYDSDRHEVSHSVNGELVSREPIPDEYLVKRIRIGDASLGNWGLPERDQPRFAIRNLNGSMDEFLLFSRPLSANEVRSLYEVSRP